MKLIKLLNRAIIKRSEADSILDSLIKKAEKIVSDNIIEKYKNLRLKKDEYEFELLGVESYLYKYDIDYSLGYINICLIYLAIPNSKIPKKKREEIEKIKQEYLKNKKITEYHHEYYKIPILHRLHYDLDPKQAISGEFSLKLSLAEEIKLT